jgi:hypothetical protein
VRKAQEWRPAPASARLLAVLLLVTVLLVGPILPARPVMAAACFGDEQLLLAPSEPRQGELLTVAAVSRFPHQQVVFEGPAGLLETTPMTVGDRFVWQATLVPDMPGQLAFTFSVASADAPVLQCAQLIALVLDSTPMSDTVAAVPPATSTEPSVLFASLHPWQSSGAAASSAPASAPSPDTLAVGHTAGASSSLSDSPVGDQPRATSTRKPIRTPSNQTERDNGNENDNEADPTPTRTHTPTRTPTPVNTPRPTSTPRPTDTPRSTNTPRPAPTDTPAPTPTLAPPEIELPEVANCGQPMTIRGERLGSSQKAVSGDVTVDGREAAVLGWSMTEIVVRVPYTIRPGNDRTVFVTVAGRSASDRLRLSCTP